MHTIIQHQLKAYYGMQAIIMTTITLSSKRLLKGLEIHKVFNKISKYSYFHCSRPHVFFCISQVHLKLGLALILFTVCNEKWFGMPQFFLFFVLRGVVKTRSKIYDGAFLRKKLLLAVSYTAQKILRILSHLLKKGKLHFLCSVSVFFHMLSYFIITFYAEDAIGKIFLLEIPSAKLAVHKYSVTELYEKILQNLSRCPEVFFCEFYKIFRNRLFRRTPPCDCSSFY